MNPSETAHTWLEETMTGLTTDLTASLLQLTNTENIFEIRLRIAKAKAIKRSAEYRKNAREKTKTYFRLLRKKTVHLITTGTTYKEQLTRMYSLGDELEEISAEFSSFLAETRTAISRLPFVYQRLFRLEPTTDINLFNARKQELEIMNNAYENWQKERFAPIALVGEKGAGMTSLIYYFVNEKNLEVVWLKPPDEESDASSEHLLKHLPQ